MAPFEIYVLGKNRKFNVAFQIVPNINTHDLRLPDKFQVKFAHSTRLYNSSIPTLQRMLNNQM